MKIIDALADKKLFISLYNRFVIYAPYALIIDGEIFDEYIAGFSRDDDRRILIGAVGDEYGIVHFGVQNGDAGMIYILFSDSNSIAIELAKIAEKWFIEKGARIIKAYIGCASPYQYILHGSETYCWAGNYHANNAFARLGYDLDLDVIVMSKKLQPAAPAINNRLDGFVIREETERDDRLALAGTYTAYVEGEWAGRCGYHFLRAISGRLGKKYGQIDIWLDQKYHATELSGGVLALAHNALSVAGVERVMLATNQALFRAVRFYEKNGYEAEPIRAYSYSKSLTKH